MKLHRVHPPRVRLEIKQAASVRQWSSLSAPQDIVVVVVTFLSSWALIQNLKIYLEPYLRLRWPLLRGISTDPVILSTSQREREWWEGKEDRVRWRERENEERGREWRERERIRRTWWQPGGGGKNKKVKAIALFLQSNKYDENMGK